MPQRKNETPIVPFLLVTSLFFLWGLSSNLLPILIPHLKKTCQLSDTQSAFVDSAYWIAYFLIALPAGLVMKQLGYKKTIIIGLFIAAIGSFLFYPAADIRTFGVFLAALFVVASGMTFLETAANPYMSLLGSAETAAQRLNFAQAFNGLGAFIAAFFLSKKILSGIELTNEQKAAMSPEQIQLFLINESHRVQQPYLIIGIVLVLVAILFIIIKFPVIAEKTENKATIQLDLSKQPRFLWGVVAQFFYVGGQVCVSSFFIRYAKHSTNLNEIAATNYLGFLLMGFMLGRYFGTWLLRYIAPHTLLAIYALINVILLVVVVFVGGQLSLYAMIGIEFFMSIMFPTIFSLAIKDLGENTKIAASFIVMAIVGGAIFPLIMGRISDASTIQWAYLVPMLCFVVVAYYGFKIWQIARN